MEKGHVMRFRLKKKKAMLNILRSAKVINEREDSFLVFTYNHGDFNFKELNDIFNMINNVIEKETKILALPSNISLNNMNECDLEHVVEAIEQMILQRQVI